MHLNQLITMLTVMRNTLPGDPEVQIWGYSPKDGDWIQAQGEPGMHYMPTDKILHITMGLPSAQDRE